MIVDDLGLDDGEDMVPLGVMLEAADRWRASKLAAAPIGGDEDWNAEVVRARDDIAAALGTAVPLSTPIDFIDADELLSTDYGDTPWLAQGLVTENAVAVVGGEPKTAKTWAALEIAIAVATKTPAFGEFDVKGAQRGAVVFLVEDNARSVRNRVRSLLQGRGDVDAGWTKRFVVKALGAMDLSDPMQLARYVATVRRLPFTPGVVVFDPLRDLHSKNEDSSGEMAPIYSALRALRTVLGCTVLFVHHASKGTKDTDGRRGGQKLRGSSALHGAVDVGLYLTKPTRNREDDTTTMACNVESEVKAAASVGDFALSLEVFDNANGEAVRAQWTFMREQPDDENSPAVQQRRTKEEALILDVLRRAHQKAPRGHPPIAKTTLALQAGGRKANMLAAIERLHLSERIRFVAGPGARALYQFVPPAEDPGMRDLAPVHDNGHASVDPNVDENEICPWDVE